LGGAGRAPVLFILEGVEVGLDRIKGVPHPIPGDWVLQDDKEQSGKFGGGVPGFFSPLLQVLTSHKLRGEKESVINFTSLLALTPWPWRLVVTCFRDYVP
jgi:hypothetical protein